MKKPKFILSAIAASILLSACASDEPANTGNNEQGITTVETPVIELSTKASRAATEVQDFNIDFFRKVALSPKYIGKNVACSPLSATMLLSLLANATSEEAAKEIAQVLGYADTQDLNELCSTLAEKLPTLDPKANLALANSVWYHENYTIDDNFISIADKFYSADVFKRDMFFNSTNVTTEINNWVSHKTNGLIENIQVAFPVFGTFINATYFKADWMWAFDKKNTSKETFYGTAGESMVDMMHREATYLYDVNEGYQAVEIKFGAGAFAAVFVLPDEDVEQLLASSTLDGILSREFQIRNIDLSLPKFKMAPSEKIDLTSILSNMGVKSLYNPNKLRLFKEDIVASQIEISQKTSIEFDEQGAEAAAVTWTDLSTSTLSDSMKFDKPFLFMIIEKSTKSVLFAGKVMNL